MTAKEIRQSFLDFMASKGHQIVPSAPMVIKDDPTLMFTNAGMNGLTGIWAACTISDVMGAVLAAILLYTQRKIFTDITPHERKVRKEAGPES